MLPATVPAMPLETQPMTARLTLATMAIAGTGGAANWPDLLSLPDSAFPGWGGHKALKKRRSRWWHELPEVQRTEVQGAGKPDSRRIDFEAVCPNKRTVGENLQRPLLRAIPAEIHKARESSRQNELARREAFDRYQRFCQEHPGLAPSSKKFQREFGRVHGVWFHEHKIGLGRGALAKLEKRLVAGVALDGRVNSGCRPQELFDADVFNKGVALYIHENKLHTRGPYSVYAYCRAKAQQEGKLWAGSPSTFAARLKEAVPEPFRKFGQRGAHVFEADAMPKLVRERDRFACGDALTLDGRREDVIVRVPKSGGGWRPVRPTTIVLFDIPSGFAAGSHIGPTETADGTLAAFKRACQRIGVPSLLETDNGKGFNCAFGSRREWAKQDARCLHLAVKFLKIDVDHKKPKEAWGKSAESRFSWTKELDRLHGSFIGGAPDERPEDVLRRLHKDITECDTLDEWRRLREQDFETYNNTPRACLNGLSPRQYFDQHRGQPRQVPADVLDFVCGRPVGERVVGRDGVLYRGLRYGRFDEAVWRLQARRVGLRVDAADLSQIWLCDDTGKPLCIATNSGMGQATGEHLREVERRRGHFRKAARTFKREHDFFYGNRIDQVRKVLAEYYQAQAAEAQRTAPQAQPGPTRIVGAELVASVGSAKRAAQRQALRRAMQPAAQTGSETASEAVSDPFELLKMPMRERTSVAATECPADLLKGFVHVNAG